jgi:hypothetical protein
MITNTQIVHTWSKSWVVGFRKLSSLSEENVVLLIDLSLSPTTVESKDVLGIEDYG